MAGKRLATGLLAGFVIWLVIAGPLRSYWRVFINRAPPQIIMVLGGDSDRERVGVQLARQMQLPLL
ncbi:MAG TPA: YdcF family protein, partial [Prochlorococcaceae cyanobacterium Fu_MAG_50]|nr:YdcF family protein [Prochlorococcaceae cyanobacterium Fu_MAG_50]